MSGKSGNETEHTLIIVEEDVLDDPDLYQVTKLEHPPGSDQVEPVHDAHRLLAQEAEEETGQRHRVVVESDEPELIETHYEMHQEKLEEAITA